MKSIDGRSTGGKYFLGVLREFAGRFSFRRESLPIDSFDLLEEFVTSRAAFVAQKTLYGYLKTRMGTRYPSMFEDDVFVHSINIAKLQVFAECLSDLAVFAVAHAFRESDLTADSRRAIARTFYVNGMRENAQEAPEEFSADDAVRNFENRLAETDWSGDALERQNFNRSAEALLHWAPIAPALKSQDADIVRNSINFTWSEVRQNFLRRLSAEDVRLSIPNTATT